MVRDVRKYQLQKGKTMNDTLVMDATGAETNADERRIQTLVSGIRNDL